MLEGLHLYEVLLMVCGVMLFLTLLAILVLYVARNKSIKALLPFFALPIAMIGFPGIRKFSYDNGKFEIERQAQALESDPHNAKAKADLAGALERVELRVDPSAASAGTLGVLAKGHLALGQDDKAYAFARRAVSADPQSSEAKGVYVKTISARVGRITKSDYKPLSDPAARRKLEEAVVDLGRLGPLSAEGHLELSKSYLALGDRSKAKASLDRARELKPALAIDPRLTAAVHER